MADIRRWLQLFLDQFRLASVMAHTRAWPERACFLCIVVLSISGLAADPAAAQSRIASDAVHEYVAASSVADAVALPPNLVTSPTYRHVLEWMIRLSPTFRRQCLRIAAERHLTIVLQAVPSGWLHGNRAMTRIVRQSNGALSATVGINPLENQIELIAHEIEHIIEQLDEIDLKSRAALPNTGVHAIDANGGMFETARAEQIGLRVSHECRGFPQPAD